MPLLSTQTTADRSTATLDPIRIVTDAIELVGFVAAGGQRITDLLLRGQDLAFLPRGADPSPDAWIAVAPSDLLFVVPPPLPRRSGWQPSTTTTQSFVRVAGYRLVGTAHRPITPDIVREQPFLPLTSVSIARDGHAGAEEVEVAIVSLARATEVRG